MAVGITHRIRDGRGLYTFLIHWANVLSQSGKQVQPYYVSSQSYDSEVPEEFLLPPKTGNVTKRFEFKNSSLRRIRAMIRTQGLPENPTRVFNSTPL